MQETLNLLLPHWYHLLSVVLMMIGFFIVIQSGNLVKKLIGLAIFQTSVLLLYVSSGYVEGSRYPILEKTATLYTNPLPHVLMLTAIVVGVATMAVGLALVVRIREEFDTIEEAEILNKRDMDG